MRRVLLFAVMVFVATAQKPAAKPQFNIKIPPFQGAQPIFFAIAGQQGRPGVDAWTVALPSSDKLPAAEQFYLDQLKSQGFAVIETVQKKGGTHHTLVNKQRAIQASLSAGGKSEKPKIAIALSWLR